MIRSVEAIAVGIPARNEEALIGDCLRSVLLAAEQVGVAVSIAVVADDCRDETAAIARTCLAGAGTPRIRGAVVETAHRSAGAARALAVERALADLDAPLDRTWIATTDADTTVAPAWLRTHLAWAEAGVDGIAGLVNVDWPDGCETLPARYRAAIGSLGIGPGHPHVHGANLGLRATRWRAVGGCGTATVGEDHDLWARLRRDGANVLGVDDLVVTTSGRLTGRTPGGFARYLADLRSEPGDLDATG